MRREMFKQFLKRPKMTGSVWPSSPFLSKKITENENIRKASSLVELGPGTGAVTPHIVKAIHHETRFFTVELNSAMIPIFRKRFPNITIYNDSATNLPGILKKEGLPHVDAIISGLPWASFPAALQDELLDAIINSLPKGGFFSTYGYVQGAILPGARGFRERLYRHFSKIEKTPVVWLNVPPAFVYNCKK